MYCRRSVVVVLLVALLLLASGCGKGSSSDSGTPTITSLSVTAVTVGSPNTTESISGTNFTSSSVASFNGTALSTTFVSSTQLTAVIPNSALVTAGTFGVTVANGGKTSNSFTVTVSSSAPTISSLNPGSVTAGSPALYMTVTGSGYNANSAVNWNGTPLVTTYLDSTQLNAALPASFLAAAAAVPITVSTPGTTGGTSTAQTFNVNAAIPTVTSINPTIVSAGSGDITLTVTGTNFLANSSVQLAGSSRPTVFVSPSELSATIPAADLASAGTPAITVFNPAPQGGTSNSLPLSVFVKPANQPPVAVPGQDQTVAVGSTVNLSGYGSSDTSGNPLTFQWTLASRPAGSSAVLSSTTSPTPNFVADQAGNYSVQLIVNDGANSSAASVVSISTVNSAPVANAGANQSARIGTTVQLDGTGSTDFDGNRITYTWAFTSVPAGSSAVLSSTTGAQPTFVVDKPGSYVARLIVNDGVTDSAASTVTVSTTNTAPVASAGASVTLPLGTTVHLDGSSSSDFDGNPLTYSWAITSAPTGSSAGLSNASSVRPTFVADKAGTYLVQLIVNDGTVNSVPSTMTVSTVSTPPVAFAGEGQKTAAGATVQLDGSGSTDAEGGPLTYRWALIARPTGSSAALSSTAEPRPTFTADVVGIYVAQVIVRDAQWVSAPSTVTIASTNNAPVANAGSAQTVTAGTSVQLDGTHSTDVDGNPLHFAWSILNKPATSAAILSDATVPNPVFVAEKAGDYVLQLIVNDGHSYSAPSTVTISTSAVAPVANAGAAQLVAVGGTAQLDGSASFDPDGGNLNYSWSLLSSPAGSAAALSNALAQKPTLVTDVAGDYNLQLIVSNGTLQSAPSTIVVSTSYAPAIADPGTSQSVNVGATATLAGGGSTSPQGSALTYRWSLIAQPAGSTATLNNASSQSPAFTLDRRGAYVAQLIVNDGHADSLPRTVTVTSSNRAPIANAGPAQSPSIGSVVTLDGSGSSDPDGYPLTYQWRFTAIPNGSTATLAAATSASPTFTADTLGTYKLELIVSDGLLSSAASTVTITVGPNTSISFSPSPLDLNANQASSVAVTIGQVAGIGGVTINLTSSNASIVTVPATVTIPAGSSSASFTATAQLTAGSAIITGSATGYTTGSVTANITVNSMSMPNVTVGKNLQTSSVVTFGVAPTTAIDITLTSSDPSKVIVSNAPTSGGSGSATVHVNASSTTSLSFFIQGLADSGTVTLTAKAAGYVDTTSTVTLAPSGIIVRSGILDTLNTTASSPDSTLTVAPAYLDPTTKAVLGTESIRGGLGTQTIKLTNSSTSVGTLSASSVSLKPGDSSTTVKFHPLTTGSTDVSLAQPSGFTAPSNFTTLHVVVGQADITVQNLSVGQDLQAADTVFLSAPAPTGGVDVNLTSSDPSKVLLSTSPTTAGSSSVTVHVNGGVQGLPVFYVQALAGTGTVTLSAKGTGLNDGSATVTLMPSGFVITSGNINSGATGDTVVTLGTAVLQPGTLAPTGTSQGLRPGASPVNLALTGSNPAVGTITSPVAFAANAKSATATFHAVSAGNTTISLQTPAGFSTPSLYQSITAAVGLPSLNTSTSIRVGKDLQQWNQVTLGATPSNPVAVSITSNSPAIAIVSNSATTAGSASISFNGITGATPNFYIQGVSIGTTTLTVSAPGYADATIHVTVNPSGFIMDSTNFSTSIANDTTVTIAPAVLDATSLNFVALQPLRGGLAVAVPMTTDAPASGTITSPVSFASNQAAGNATFHAIANGTVNITVGTPSGFSTPTTYASITATVGLPSISSSIPVMTIGKDLQQGNQATLNTTPSAAVSVTITSNTPSIATVSSDPSAAGTSSVTLTNITSSTPVFFIQGLSLGTATFTISASGYTDSIIHVTVNPSGFIMSSNNFTSSVGSDTTVTLQSGLLDPNTLAFVALQPVRGGLTVQVPMTSGTPATGTITTPVQFAPNQAGGSATFHAIAVGTSTVTVGTPSGFSTPSARTSITATVQ